MRPLSRWVTIGGRTSLFVAVVVVVDPVSIVEVREDRFVELTLPLVVLALVEVEPLGQMSLELLTLQH